MTLIAQIKAANTAYAKGIPIITDSEYDALWRQLYQEDPTHPLLYHTAQDPNLGGDSIQHLIPIYGTQKAFCMDDMKPFLQRFGTKPIQVEPKYDGVAAMLYNEPSGHRLVLYGNGQVGKDITRHLSHIYWLGQESSRTSVEIIIINKKWNHAWGKNQRNTVAGWLNRHDTDYPSQVMTIVSHSAGRPSASFRPPYELDELHYNFLSLYSQWSAIYPMDGLMVKLTNEKDRLIASHNSSVNMWSIAWKPPISVATTVVTDIHWKVSRLGRIIPTIEYEPVELCGTTNSMVTGNNATWIWDKQIHIEATITIGKAGEIIPKIISVTNNTINKVDIPAYCPECNSSITEEGVHLVCTSPNCIAAQVRRIAYFYSDKGIEVKSIGEKRIYELMQNPTLKAQLVKKPWMLLDSKEYIDLIESVWGMKRTVRYIDELARANATYNHAHFIAALGYPALAYKSALKCFQQLKGLPTRGNVPRKAIDSFPLALADLMKAKEDLTNFILIDIPTTAIKTYCITGTLSMDRSDMIQYLSQFGWQFSNQVSRFTDYLILGDIPHETTKSRKAAELSVTIVKECDIQTLIKENSNATKREETNSTC